MSKTGYQFLQIDDEHRSISIHRNRLRLQACLSSKEGGYEIRIDSNGDHLGTIHMVKDDSRWAQLLPVYTVHLGTGIQFKRHISLYIWCIEIEQMTACRDADINERKHSLIYSIISGNTIDTNHPLSHI